MSRIRTRFAPSPTGYLHIGGARTALFAWLYAKSRQGECLLRIEDTDKTRSKDEYTDEIINSFKWLGITFDQETIFQSHNTKRYKEMVDRLLENGSAYVCKGDVIEGTKIHEILTFLEQIIPLFVSKCRNKDLPLLLI